jgi:hypothetical protein
MRRRALWSAGWLLSVAVLAAPAADEDIENTRVKPQVPPAATRPLTPDESAALTRALTFDDVTPPAATPSGAYEMPPLAHRHALDVSRSENADGSSTVTVAQPLSDAWHAKVGADVGIAAAPETTYVLGEPLPGAVADKPSGAAFASLGVTPFASVDARVDPGNQQGKLGATLSHDVTLGDGVSLALRGHYAISDTIPPADNSGAASAPVLSNDQSVKLAIGATGTTLSAGVSGDSSDPTMHSTLSADQKVYGPLHVTTAITDAGQPTADKRVTAGFKLTW